MSTQHINNTHLSSFDGPPLSEELGLGSLTLAGFVDEIAERYANREALCWKDDAGQVHRWTYAEMYAECQRVAKALLALGAGRGTRVGVLISNRPEWLFSALGAAMAGAVAVALNTFSTRQELGYQLRLADVEILIMEAGVASRNFVADINELCPALTASEPGELYFEELPFLRRVVCVDHVACVDDAAAIAGMQPWDAFIAAGAGISSLLVNAAATASSPVDQALIFFSSGSTALPKAIQQTHRAATLQCWRFGRWFETDSSVRTWSANGFFWSGNFAMAFGSALSVGGCLVLQRYFQPDEALELLASEKVSQIIAWPHQEARLTECPAWKDTDLSSLKYIDKNSVIAAHPSVATNWSQCNGYGMTETFTFVVAWRSSENRDGSHGEVLPGNSLRIVDPDTGAVLPIGQAGEIIVKGPTLTSGYLKIPPEDSFDRDGFIHTGDAGYLNADGHLFWQGRLSDIIKTGGANVSPAEIDAVLAEHPAVHSLFTVGVPHKTLGEIVVSCVVPRHGQHLEAADLKNFAKQSLASYKVPREVLFFSEDELPMTGSNKIRRPELRKLAAARLAQTE